MKKRLIFILACVMLLTSCNSKKYTEGIETEEQLKLIREMACPTAQGFYFYKPMPIEQVDELIN